MEKDATGCPSLPSHYGLMNPGTRRTSPAVYPTRRRTAELTATEGRWLLSVSYRKAIWGIMIWSTRLTSSQTESVAVNSTTIIFEGSLPNVTWS